MFIHPGSYLAWLVEVTSVISISGSKKMMGNGEWGMGNIKLPSWMTVLIKLIDDLTLQWAVLTVAMQTDIF